MKYFLIFKFVQYEGTNLFNMKEPAEHFMLILELNLMFF